MITIASASSGQAHASGRFDAWFVDKNGVEQWREQFPNGVTILGKNLALDSFLGASGGTAPGGSGPYFGLISSTSFTTLSSSDTQSSHPSWLEAGAANHPHYSGSRPTAVFNAASGAVKSLTAALSVAITSNGTVKGLFLVYGTGASATIDNTGGTLYSTGLFTAGDQLVTTGGTLFFTYQASL